MEHAEFFSYLVSIRAHAVSAECARDSIRAAEAKLTKVSCAGMDGVRVSSGSVDYDRTAMRVYALQCIREARGRRLHEDVAALREFRSRLDSCGLGEDEANALWCKYALGMRNAEIAERLGMDARHVYPAIVAARGVLAEHMGAERLLEKQDNL